MQYIRKNYPFIILTLLVLIFFFPFFYPTPKILVTPDFGQSDIWNLNYPYKDNLAKHLKQFQLPLWSDQIATGYPVFAEGQTGTLNIVNLILFFLFPTWLAFNLGYITIFLTTALGTYWYCRIIKLTKVQSLWASLIFTFSGVFVARLQHFNLIQTASFLPIIFALTELTIRKKRLLEPLLLSTILSQQFFSGFPQFSFITLFGVTIYAILRIYFEKKDSKKIIIYLLISLFLFFGLSAVQILPTKEFLDQSPRSTSLSFEESTRFPYPPKHLITFIFPFFFGNPAIGTYPAFNENWGIFWENTAYLGILPLILLFITIVKKSYKKNKIVIILWLLLVISLFLSFGKNSPFYLLFTVFPFNLFRVPSRFLILAAFAISILSAFPLRFIFSKNKILPQKIITTFLFLILILQLYLFGNNFKPLGRVEDWLKKPETVQVLEKLPKNRIYSIPSYAYWNQEFLKKGWQKENRYYFIRNNLTPNQNMLYNISSLGVYPILTTRRFKLVNDEIEKGLTINFSINNASISASALALLENNNVGYLISPHHVANTNLKEIKTIISTDKNMIYYLYRLEKTLPKFRTVQNYQTANSIKNLINTALNNNFQKVTILEDKPAISLANENISHLKIISDKETEKLLEVESKNKTLFVIANSFYPGWKAKIDGVNSVIFPTNINQQAIFLSSGKHKIEIYYSPKSLFMGKIISLFSIITIIILLLKSSSKFFKRPFLSRFNII